MIKKITLRIPVSTYGYEEIEFEPNTPLSERLAFYNEAMSAYKQVVPTTNSITKSSFERKATEKQVSYANSLGGNFNSGSTFKEVSSFIESKKNT